MRVQRWLMCRYVTLRSINKTPPIHKAADFPVNQTVKSASKSETLQLQSYWKQEGVNHGYNVTNMIELAFKLDTRIITIFFNKNVKQSKWYLKGFTYVSVEEEAAWLLGQWSSCLCSHPEHAQGGRMANCQIPLPQFCLSPLEGALVEPRQLQVDFYHGNRIWQPLCFRVWSPSL